MKREPVVLCHVQTFQPLRSRFHLLGMIVALRKQVAVQVVRHRDLGDVSQPLQGQCRSSGFYICWLIYP